MADGAVCHPSGCEFNVARDIPGIRGRPSYGGQIEFLKVSTCRRRRFSGPPTAISTALGALSLGTLLLLKLGDFFFVCTDYRNLILGADCRRRFGAVRVLLVLLVRDGHHGRH